MPAHCDHPPRPELPGGQHARQADRPIADDHHGRAPIHLGAHSRVPACAHHVRQGQQTRQQVITGPARSREQRAVGVRNPDEFGLATVIARAVQAVRMHTGAADHTGVVAGQKSSNDEVALLDRGHAATDSFDDADIFVPDRGPLSAPAVSRGSARGPIRTRRPRRCERWRPSGQQSSGSAAPRGGRPSCRGWWCRAWRPPSRVVVELVALYDKPCDIIVQTRTISAELHSWAGDRGTWSARSAAGALPASQFRINRHRSTGLKHLRWECVCAKPL